MLAASGNCGNKRRNEEISLRWSNPETPSKYGAKKDTSRAAPSFCRGHHSMNDQSELSEVMPRISPFCFRAN